MMQATTASQMSVTAKVNSSVRRMPPETMGRPSAAVVRRALKLMRPLSSMPDSDAKLMMPKPPNWMRTMMTVCPKGVQ